MDAAFGPVFRFLDAFETLADVHLATGLMRLAEWQMALASRPSLAGAVATDYPERLAGFLHQRHSHLSRIMAERAPIEERAFL